MEEFYKEAKSHTDKCPRSSIMQKWLLLLFLSISFNLFAQSNEGYLNIDPFVNDLTQEAEDSNDIAYLYMAPQFEENPDPKKAVVIEFYFGEFDGTAESYEKLNLIKEIMQDDIKVKGKLPIDIWGVSAESDNETKEFKQIVNHLGLKDAPKKFEKVPEQIYFNPSVYGHKTSYVKKKQDRIPSALNPGRNFWTFARFSAGAAPTTAGLIISNGLAPGIAAAIGVWPGIASGAITYFNGPYGNFLTSGSWAKWMLESDKKFAKMMRSGLGLNEKSLAQHLVKTKSKYSKSKYFKDLLQKNPDEFKRIVEKDAQIAFSRQQNRIKNISSKFGMVDEYVKWWATEVAFVTTAIKIPQAVGGVATGSFLGSVGEVLTGSTMGMIAQGPGDIAIQKRKYQKITELKKYLKDGMLKIPDEKTFKKFKKMGLLTAEEVKYKDMILKKGGTFIDDFHNLKKQIAMLENKSVSYTIGKQSHLALRRIENWARSRATLLSMFSVAGVSMELAGIPLARPILVGVGLGGGLYYSQVAGWLNKDRIKKLFKQDIRNYFAKIRAGEVDFSLKGLLLRLCYGKMKSKRIVN